MGRHFRNITFKVHTWLGLHLSLFLAFMFLTGSILAVSRDLEVAFNPKIWTSLSDTERTASFGSIYETVSSSEGVRAVSIIEKQPGTRLADLAYVYSTRGAETVWIDPASSAVVDVERGPGFAGILSVLHETLMTDHLLGYLLVSGTSFLLLALIVSGLVSYKRFWKGFLRRPTDRLGRRGWFGGLHRLLALWSGALMLVIALTTVIFFLAGLGINGQTPSPPPAQERADILPEGFGEVTIDQAEAVARTALPGFAPNVMFLPRNKREGITFVGNWDGGAQLIGPAQVFIDPVTMDLLATFTPADNKGIARLGDLVDHLHYGTWGGLPSRLLWFGLGLVGFGVAVSGILTFSARQDGIHHDQVSAIRRVWTALGIFRWAYALLVLGMIASTIYHYAL
ncbi:PepSY-associated TM helix domain-containing protein [Ruegeria sp.]|uniref:PepSY-associated TM helix domain-containing protein n=1 Tax=Ruegeria sp. TaxID=1879320 RepID=UPI003C7E6706